MARKQLGSNISGSNDATNKAYVDAAVSGGSVAYDATGTGSGSHFGSGTTSWTHTASGTNRLVLVAVATGAFNTSSQAAWTTTATYDGVAMTWLGVYDSGDPAIDGYQGFLEVWYMFNPPTGAKTVQISSLLSGNPPTDLTGNSVSYTGVQSLGGLTEFYDNATSTSFDIPSAPNTYTVGMFAAGDPITSQTQTQRYEHDTSAFNGAGCLLIADAVGTRGSITFGATSNAFTDWAKIGLTLYPTIVESGVMHLGGDEQISGIKSFYGPTTYTKQLWVEPGSSGQSAAVSLDNDNGQVWQETNNNSGVWALYDSTHASAPITVDANSLDGALVIDNVTGVNVRSGTFVIADSTDATKKAKVDISGLATGRTTTILTSAPRVTSITSSATPAFNTDNCDLVDITALAVNITSMTPSGTPANGQKLMIRIKGAASQTITWGSSYQSSGVGTLLAATVAGKEHHVGLIYSAGVSKWVCIASDATGY